jgi:hypothetical protein
MPRLSHAVATLFLALPLLGGCCRDTIREMGSLKDVVERPRHRSAAVAGDHEDRSSKSARVEKDDDDDDDDRIETGSVAASERCQGAHLAYQATREYLKNFGPKPPDQPGDKGACKGQQ